MDGISLLVVTCGMECSLVGHRAESITGMAVKNHSGDWATLVWGLAPPSKSVFVSTTLYRKRGVCFCQVNCNMLKPYWSPQWRASGDALIRQDRLVLVTVFFKTNYFMSIFLNNKVLCPCLE